MTVRSAFLRLLLCGWLAGAGLGSLMAAPITGTESEPVVREGVVLLHGLTRSPRSMRRMARTLTRHGYVVANIGYPSRKQPIEALAAPAIEKGVDACRAAGVGKIHFVTHSMGGILLRFYLQDNSIAELGRIVMLSPPNQGSEVTDKLGGLAPYRWLNGPAGDQLGTGTNSVPLALGPLDAEVGVLTGSHTINFILSGMIPGRDDGKVSPARAKLEGMDDFRIMPVSHPFIMRDKSVVEEVLYFLAQGVFTPADS